MDDPCPRLIVRSRLPAAVQRYPPRHSWSFAEEPGSMFAALGKERPCSANGAYNGTTLRRDDARVQTYHIVEEDEADPKSGSFSFVSAVVTLLMGCWG